MSKLFGYSYILHPESPLLLQIDLPKILFSITDMFGL